MHVATTLLAVCISTLVVHANQQDIRNWDRAADCEFNAMKYAVENANIPTKTIRDSNMLDVTASVPIGSKIAAGTIVNVTIAPSSLNTYIDYRQALIVFTKDNTDSLVSGSSQGRGTTPGGPCKYGVRPQTETSGFKAIGLKGAGPSTAVQSDYPQDYNIELALTPTEAVDLVKVNIIVQERVNYQLGQGISDSSNSFVIFPNAYNFTVYTCNPDRCVDCNENTPDTCTKCETDYEPTADGSRCKWANTCSLTNCGECENANTCRDCEQGWAFPEFSTQCTKYVGACFNNDCATCSGPGQDASCSQCKAGFFTSFSSGCVPCMENCDVCDNGTGSCNRCSDGYEYTATGEFQGRCDLKKSTNDNNDGNDSTDGNANSDDQNKGSTSTATRFQSGAFCPLLVTVLTLATFMWA